MIKKHLEKSSTKMTFHSILFYFEPEVPVQHETIDSI